MKKTNELKYHQLPLMQLPPPPTTTTTTTIVIIIIIIIITTNTAMSTAIATISIAHS
ncbi:hypothetical protein WUBG_17413, partial [Wuchereria bancrofti]